MDAPGLSRVVCEKLACFGMVGVEAPVGHIALRRVTPGDLAEAPKYGAPTGEHVLYQKLVGSGPWTYVKDADLRAEVLAVLEDGATKVQVGAIVLHEAMAAGNVTPRARAAGDLSTYVTANSLSVRAPAASRCTPCAHPNPKRSSTRGADGTWSEFAWEP